MIPWWAALIIGLVACFFTAWCIDRMRQADDVERRMAGLESAASRIDRWQQNSVEHSRQQAESYKAMLFDAWQTMAGQTRGLQRQSRKIKRLQAQLKALPSENNGQD